MPCVHKDNQNKKSFQVPVKTKANAPKNYNTHWLQYVHTKLNSLSFISSTFASEFKPADSISSAPITGFQVPTTVPLFFFVAVKNVKSIWLLWLLKNAITRRPSGSREDAHSFMFRWFAQFLCRWPVSVCHLPKTKNQKTLSPKCFYKITQFVANVDITFKMQMYLA